MTIEPCLVVDGVTVEYVTDGYSVKSLDNFSMVANPGELVALIGPSGSGKTTLLSVLSGMVPTSSGAVSMNNIDVLGLSGRALENYRRSKIGIVFQGFNLLPSLSARENVAAFECRRNRVGLNGSGAGVAEFFKTLLETRVELECIE